MFNIKNLIYSIGLQLLFLENSGNNFEINKISGGIIIIQMLF